jgi:hypothetical protein
MYEIYVFLFSIVFWGLIYQLVIIPRTASASFSVWREKLKGDPELLLDICEPLLDEIAEMISTNFQSFWGSISQLGKKAEGLNPNEAMKKAIAKGDLFQILAEYVGNKAGLGGLQGLIPAQEEPKQDQNQGLTKL